MSETAVRSWDAESCPVRKAPSRADLNSLRDLPQRFKAEAMPARAYTVVPRAQKSNSVSATSVMVTSVPTASSWIGMKRGDAMSIQDYNPDAIASPKLTRSWREFVPSKRGIADPFPHEVFYDFNEEMADHVMAIGKGLDSSKFGTGDSGVFEGALVSLRNSFEDDGLFIATTSTTETVGAISTKLCFRVRLESKWFVSIPDAIRPIDPPVDATAKTFNTSGMAVNEKRYLALCIDGAEWGVGNAMTYEVGLLSPSAAGVDSPFIAHIGAHIAGSPITFKPHASRTILKLYFDDIDAAITAAGGPSKVDFTNIGVKFTMASTGIPANYGVVCVAAPSAKFVVSNIDRFVEHCQDAVSLLMAKRPAATICPPGRFPPVRVIAFNCPGVQMMLTGLDDPSAISLIDISGNARAVSVINPNSASTYAYNDDTSVYMDVVSADGRDIAVPHEANITLKLDTLFGAASGQSVDIRGGILVPSAVKTDYNSGKIRIPSGKPCHSIGSRIRPNHPKHVHFTFDKNLASYDMSYADDVVATVKAALLPNEDFPPAVEITETTQGIFGGNFASEGVSISPSRFLLDYRSGATKAVACSVDVKMTFVPSRAVENYAASIEGGKYNLPLAISVPLKVGGFPGAGSAVSPPTISILVNGALSGDLVNPTTGDNMGNRKEITAPIGEAWEEVILIPPTFAMSGDAPHAFADDTIPSPNPTEINVVVRINFPDGNDSAEVSLFSVGLVTANEIVTAPGANQFRVEVVDDWAGNKRFNVINLVDSHAEQPNSPNVTDVYYVEGGARLGEIGLVTSSGQRLKLPLNPIFKSAYPRHQHNALKTTRKIVSSVAVPKLTSASSTGVRTTVNSIYARTTTELAPSSASIGGSLFNISANTSLATGLPVTVSVVQPTPPPDEAEVERLDYLHRRLRNAILVVLAFFLILFVFYLYARG